MGDTWQIGTTSIREDHKIASGLRFIHWCHASPNVQAKQNSKNDPTVRVYQHIEDQLTKAGSDTDDILALTTTREGATNLRNYFSIAGKKANAKTAVKVAGATAKHCIVIHGESTFLSGEGRNLDYDQECFTLRLVLATITRLTKAEINSLVEGPYLPGGTVLHDLVYGYAADASMEPEWLVITDGQQPGHWRLLHNSSGPGRRCSVGSSLRYQPTPST